MTNQDCAYWIEKLRLERHPEGGYFRQTYKAELLLPKTAIPAGFGGARAASTAIYFLLSGDHFSAFHRLRSDEIWHFYAGTPLEVHVIDPSGAHSIVRLGSDLDAGQVLQAVVPAGCWFASHVADWKSFAVVGCTVAPGFEFEDFEMGNRAELIRQYPQHGRLYRSSLGWQRCRLKQLTLKSCFNCFTAAQLLHGRPHHYFTAAAFLGTSRRCGGFGRRRLSTFLQCARSRGRCGRRGR